MPLQLSAENSPILKPGLQGWLVLGALGFFVLWIVSALVQAPRRCPAGSKWDNAPVLGVCQKICGENEISDGRGQCVSSELPWLHSSYDALARGEAPEFIGRGPRAPNSGSPTADGDTRGKQSSRALGERRVYSMPR